MTNEELIERARRVGTNDVVANPRGHRALIADLADALEAATVEPEWVYRARTSRMTSGTHKTAEAARATANSSRPRWSVTTTARVKHAPQEPTANAHTKH